MSTLRNFYLLLLGLILQVITFGGVNWDGLKLTSSRIEFVSPQSGFELPSHNVDLDGDVEENFLLLESSYFLGVWCEIVIYGKDDAYFQTTHNSTLTTSQTENPQSGELVNNILGEMVHGYFSSMNGYSVRYTGFPSRDEISDYYNYYISIYASYNLEKEITHQYLANIILKNRDNFAFNENSIKEYADGLIFLDNQGSKINLLNTESTNENSVANFSPTELGSRWYQHKQFGTFYDANNSDWYYHLDHGWIFVKEWDDNGTWMYMPLVDETPIHSYMHFDGTNYTAVFKWDEFAASTGLSLDFLKAIAQQSGTDPYTFTNEGNQTINVTDTAEPFGWVWTNSSTQNFLYNNKLEEWFYFNKDIPKSEARFYSYNQKCYITPQEIRKRDYAQDVWREILSSYGLEKLNDLNRSVGIDENRLDFSDGTPVIITVNIPKVEIQEDDFWFPLIKTLTQQQIILKKYYRLFEDENFYRLEIRSVLWDSVLNTEPYGFSNDTNQRVDSVNDDRQASAKGLNDNGSMEAIALEKSGLIDLENEEQAGKVDKYIEVAAVASGKFEEKVQNRYTYRKDADRFTRDLVSNFEQVVDLVIEADSIGIKDDTVLDSLLENADNAKEVNEIQKEAQNLGLRDVDSLAGVFRNADKADELKEVINVAAEIGVKKKENLHAVFQNADKAVELKSVLDVARETLGEDDGLGVKKLDSSKASILLSTLKNADKATQLKQIMEVSIELGLNDPENLSSVFQNSDQATDLLEVLNSADEAGVKDKVTLAAVFQNADKANDLMAVIEKTLEINVQEAVELSSAFEVSLKVLDSKDSLTNEEIATLLSSQNGSLDDSNLSLTVDSVILE